MFFAIRVVGGVRYRRMERQLFRCGRYGPLEIALSDYVVVRFGYCGRESHPREADRHRKPGSNSAALDALRALNSLGHAGEHDRSDTAGAS